MNKVKFIIVPDVHGRTFWRDVVYDYLKNTTDVKIIFLGDYVDPYGYEDISKEDAFCVLEEIIELKMKYSDRVVLLIGNHDFHYFNGNIGGCRKDMMRKEDLRALYENNIDLFTYYYIEEIGGVKYLFSHAGFLNSWLYLERGYIGIWEKLGGDLSDEHPVRQDVVDAINIDLIESIDFKEVFNDKQGRLSMNTIGSSRGGMDVGSFMWADLSDHLGIDEEIKGCVQVFGHTQQEFDPVRIGNCYCLDCRECFYLFEDGIYRHIEGGVYNEIPDTKEERLEARRKAFEKYKHLMGAFI